MEEGVCACDCPLTTTPIPTPMEEGEAILEALYCCVLINKCALPSELGGVVPHVLELGGVAKDIHVEGDCERKLLLTLLSCENPPSKGERASPL